MSVKHSTPVCLRYGADGRFSHDIDSARLVAWHSAPPPCRDVAQTIRTALTQTLEFPPLDQTVFPGDRVVLAIDRRTPQAAEIVEEVWRICEQRSIAPSDLCILQPAALDLGRPADPRRRLPADAAKEITWKIYDPTDKSSHVYLATTSTGERVYLARDVVEADVVIPIGCIAFDSVIGYRGTGSVLYPGMSTPDAMRRAHGQGHQELGPDDNRPMRDFIDEIAWLLGVQFTIQTIASHGDGTAHVLAGEIDAVFRRGKELLNESWRVKVPKRSDVVVAAIDTDTAGHGWEHVGIALAAAMRLVTQNGKIVILSELDAEVGEGIQLVRESEAPHDALKPLRKQTPVDLIPATQLALATDWARVYFLSRLDSNIVEDLFAIPLETEQEVHRLLDDEGSCTFLEAAQHTYGLVE